MIRMLQTGAAILAVLAGSVVGYRIGAGAWPGFVAAGTGAPGAVPATARIERKVLYWQHPDGSANYSATPARTSDGRDFVPVYDDAEKDFAEEEAKAKAATANADRKILYYRNPMGLPDTSPTPKKDWMGMDYIPVYEGEDDGGATVRVSLDKVQRAGVRTAPVERRRLDRVVRAPGIVKPDERTLYTATLRTDGFIEKLYVNETGRHVQAGEPLFRVYAPQMVSVQVDYRISNAVPNSREEDGALQRLRNLGMPENVLDELRRTREPILSFDWPSPVSGIVMQKNVVEGQMVKAGDEMFRFADLSRVWVIADVAEQDVGEIDEGQTARITLRAFPGEVFTGKVTFILHELDAATRTAKVRVEVDNPDMRIRHEMFADVEIDQASGKPQQLVVPSSALIDSGTRQVVIVDRGEGRFEPRHVKVGARGKGFVAIAEGIKEGESVVVAANFLIDAESNLKAALSSFTADGAEAPATGEHKGHAP